jgi:hypothetical protein
VSFTRTGAVGCIPGWSNYFALQDIGFAQKMKNAGEKARHQNRTLNKIAGILMAMFKVKKKGALRGNDYTSFPKCPQVWLPT